MASPAFFAPTDPVAAPYPLYGSITYMPFTHRCLFAALALCGALNSAHAASPRDILASLERAAEAPTPGYNPVDAGKNFYNARSTRGRVESCATCHTPNPKEAGRHARTHKAIDPLSPAVAPERFTDPEKVEKWFKRNCNEVLGRACTPREKADFAAYVISVK